MKFASCIALLVVVAAASNPVAASAVAPSVTGTVSQITPLGSSRQVTINGHTYLVTPSTLSDASASALKPGQRVTFFLDGDGRKVVISQTATAPAKHP